MHVLFLWKGSKMFGRLSESSKKVKKRAFVARDKSMHWERVCGRKDYCGTLRGRGSGLAETAGQRSRYPRLSFGSLELRLRLVPILEPETQWGFGAGDNRRGMSRRYLADCEQGAWDGANDSVICSLDYFLLLCYLCTTG